MTETHVISALIEKRRRLDGERRHLRGRVMAVTKSLEALDATIRQFDPDLKPRNLKPIAPRPRNAFFLNGEGSRIVLEVLRGHPEGRTLPEIVNACAELAEIELDAVDRNALRLTVHNVLKGLVRRGRIEVVSGEVSKWAIA